MVLAAAVAIAAGSAGAQGPPAGARTSCTACHSDATFFEGEALRIVADFRDDVHARVGLSCHDCHGGNPDPALAEDLAAMDEGFAPNPYRGAPERTAVPAACGRCHSDPDYMRRFRPDLRVDQEAEYRTSHHGRRLAQGDTRVATCVDCHGVHGIARIGEARSRVHPKQVAETCKACHGDPKRMAGSVRSDGKTPFPIDQYAHWRQSVHAAALLERDDLSAPTCNDCHGNHGATPPGVGSVAFVCGQCHGREAELFRASPKQEGFAAHNELLAGVGEGGCANCHEAPEPQAAITSSHPLSECTACHGNHAIVRPTVAMLSLPATPCAFCHESPGALAAGVAEPRVKRENYERMRDGLLAEAERQGIQGDDRFDWLVDRALALPTHTLPEGPPGPGGAPLRPEFERLFTKFRIGKVHFTYEDPATGKPARAAVVRCADCHSESPQLAGEPAGRRTAGQFLARMRELTAATARAERIFLSARRGGVETREALAAIDAAVDAQIELEVLVHTFAAHPQSEFVKKHREGMDHSRAALLAGQSALDELAYRRRGLAVSLVLIVLVLIGLAIKIRQLP
jgi:hypothetical protein